MTVRTLRGLWRICRRHSRRATKLGVPYMHVVEIDIACYQNGKALTKKTVEMKGIALHI